MEHEYWIGRTGIGYLADFVAATHLAYVSYVVFGQLLILVGMAFRWHWPRARWFRVSHLVMIWIVAIEAVLNITCPLTTFESRLREWADQKTSERTFVGRLIDRVLFLNYYEEEEEPTAEAPGPSAGSVAQGTGKSAPSGGGTSAAPEKKEKPKPEEVDLTAAYVGFALFTSLTYWLYPPWPRRKPPQPPETRFEA